MRAVQLTSLDGPRAVVVVETPEPEPGPGNVVIDVHAAGVTFPEVLQTRGLYQFKPPLPYTPGSEIAGVVRTAPEGASVRPGDRVAALTLLGGFADVAIAGADLVFPLPDGVGFDVGAALVVNYLTAQFALTLRARLRDGETVLVHGAAGGLGLACVQYARALGARVIAVASTPAKQQVARDAGAHDVIPADDFRSAVKDLTDGRGVDVLVDPVGGDRFTDSLRSLASQGRLVVLGFVGGEIPTVRVNRLLLNNVSVVGAAWGEFALAHPGYVQEQWTELTPLIASGALKPPIGHALPLEQAGEALALMEERNAVGRSSSPSADGFARPDEPKRGYGGTVSVRTSGVRQQSIWPSIVSDDAAALREWLLALGFTADLLIPGERDGTIHHCQLDWPEGGRIMLSSADERPTPCVPGTNSLHVVTADPDAVLERARALGATVVHEMTDHTDYPSRDFTIADPDGNYWTFATFAG